MTLVFTPEALSDLQSIRAYTPERWGAQQERFYLDALWAKFEAILAQPDRWRTRNDLFPGCQLAAQGRHVILFRIEGSAANCPDSSQLNGFSSSYCRRSRRLGVD
jgi:plasmid stabilization system protein ParE